MSDESMTVEEKMQHAERWIKRLRRLLRDKPVDLISTVEGEAINFYLHEDMSLSAYTPNEGGIGSGGSLDMSVVRRVAVVPFPDIGGGDPGEDYGDCTDERLVELGMR